MNLTIHPPKKFIINKLEMPGSLSYTTRSLILASLTKNIVKLKNTLLSDDTKAMKECLKKLGIEINENGTEIEVVGNWGDVEDVEKKLFINLSGRTARSILPFCCICKGVQVITGAKEFNERRPVKDLVDGLRDLGAEIEYLEKDGFLPVKVNSSKLNNRKVKIPGNISSQFFSGILMIAPMIGGVEIEVEGEQTSKSYLDITFDIMKTFGVSVENQNYKKYIVKKASKYTIEEYIVEGDASSATYFWSMAAIRGEKIITTNMNPESAQGDIKFVKLLEEMGCKIEVEKNQISVTGKDSLKGINCDMNSMPDTATSLAMVACFAKNKTFIYGLDNLKVKETDRLEMPKKEFNRLGIKVETGDDWMKIFPVLDKNKINLKEKIETYQDHRIAMSFAILAAKLDGVKISDAEVVGKSFPNFWEKLKELGFKINYERIYI